MTRPKREPDVETRGFRLWKEVKGEDYGGALLTVKYNEGEEIHESRSYLAFILGYTLLVLSKKKGNQYWWAVKGKRPDGTAFLTTNLRGPLSLEEYEKQIAEFERNFAFVFDTGNPLVTPGKHYNLYMRRKERSR